MANKLQQFTKSQLASLDGKEVRIVTRQTLADEEGKVVVHEGGVYFVSEYPVHFDLVETDAVPLPEGYEFAYEIFSPSEAPDKVGGHGVAAVETL